MIAKSTLDFLGALRKNNNREWFQKNRDRYDAAKENMEEFVEALIAELGKADKSLKGLRPKDCLFRIYRDVRFSKNKSPYKSNFGAVISAGGRKTDQAGFYIQVEPGNAFIAGGRWMPSPEHLKEIRQEILYNSAAFKKVLGAKDFKKNFKSLHDSRLKLAPKGFDKDFKDIELLKYTSYIVDTPVPDKVLLSKNAFAHCRKVQAAMMPLLKFLNKATG